jgi:outer membrane protein TolC
VALIALFGAALGGGAEELSLAAAMRRARESAPEVGAALAREQAQQARWDEAKGHRLPTVSLSETWIRTDAPADVFGLLLNQERFSFQDFVQSDPNGPSPLESATTRLEVSVPVYTGGELSTRIEQARRAAEAAAGAVRRSGDIAAYEAGEAYVRLLQAREQAALLERALETVEAHVEVARAYVDEGMIVSSELLRAEVEAARLRDQLTATRGGARVAETALSFELGSHLGASWSLDPVGEPPPLEGGIERWLPRAGQRHDLVAMRHRVEAADLEARAVKARQLPRVGISARYDLVDDTLLGTDGDHYALVAMASVDLFSGGRHRAAEQAARAEHEAARREVEQMEEGIELEIRSAYLGAETARDRLTTARATLGAARETERILQERFRQGLVRTVDLLDATTARTEAEARETVARAEAHLGSLRLALAAGIPPEEILATSERTGETE